MADNGKTGSPGARGSFFVGVLFFAIRSGQPVPGEKAN